ncbi:PREDICTED: pentatricopeptide repeat-containing protein At3g13160, mitochondrial [Tarenaya hassleriana]|uniref:pentatricopeptide repeat-containing protein At3g13160, mitochondrial n=1 Tax=Tarenaya hassleriana TaxID=28532 RepID=UPI00053C66D4|nr:PREDICTED: pentatricopeptide repeat-containing protein At3g13160, mitochondrial [Tarenaya hassleriana]
MSKEGFTARIISLYGKAGMFENAQKVFDEMPEHDCNRTVLSFNALLGACLNSKKLDLFDGLFRDLPGKLSIEPDVVSYNTLIKALCEKGSLDDAVSVLDEIESKGLEPDLFTFNTLLCELYKNGQFERGEEIWSKMMEKKNVSLDGRSYNARLLGLSMQRKSKDLVVLFEEMKNKGIKPDDFSFNSMIRGFINEGKLDEAKTWYSEMEKNDCRPNKSTFAIMLPVLCKSGDLGYAFELCKEIFNKRHLIDKVILQQVVDELVKGSKGEEAKELLELAKSNDYLRIKLGMASE